MAENNEYIDVEETRRIAREYAESIFTNDTDPHVEEGHEFDFMRIYDSHETDE